MQPPVNQPRLKNPFAVRDGAVITISDISERERGLDCNCYCPHCHGRFEARLGEIRIHHFSHLSGGCDEEAAFVSGLYSLFMEYIVNNDVVIPKLSVFWAYSKHAYTKEAFFERISYVTTMGRYNEELLLNQTQLRFESAEIAHKNNLPCAILAHCKGRTLAFCLVPPPTVCKTYSAKAYKEISSLAVDLHTLDFNAMNREQLFESFAQKLRFAKWLFNSRAIDALDRVNQKNSQWQEKVAIEEEQKKKQRNWQPAHESDGYSRKHSQKSKDSTPNEVVREQNQVENTAFLNREDQLKKGFCEVKSKFTQQDEPIRDSYGQRWVQCKMCGKIKPDFEFPSYGGRGSVNLGVCKECTKKDTK